MAMTSMGGDNQCVLSVSELTDQLKSVLRHRFRDVWVSGEISNLSRAQSGHIYLSLGDQHAQLRGLIWRSTAVDLGFDLADGLEVVCRGEVDIYPPRGTYQLIIRYVEPLGLGALQLAFRQLHAKLASEGLFDESRKRPLPRFPRRIGIVTSPTGAAINDFLQVASRRWPNLQFLIIPARVQGQGAALEISQGIQIANRLKPKLDVLVLTRGGGSIEDLWCFNHEQVVRAIAASRIPTISAVGHEIDVTLSDLSADVRALTPSQAGELVVAEKRIYLRQLDDAEARLRLSLQATLSMARSKVDSLADRAVLQRPELMIQSAAARLGVACNGLRGALRTAASVAQERLNALQTRPVLARPSILLEPHKFQYQRLVGRLHQVMAQRLERRQGQMASLSAQLQAISPLRVLARGYSVTQDLDGQPIVDAQETQVGQTVKTRLARGKITSQITEIEAHSAASGKVSEQA